MSDDAPRTILARFYTDNRLAPDGGLSSRSVKIELTRRIHFYFPNFEARRKAVVKHDMHHLITGYSASSISGESEISAWEIASGCKKYWAAFLIDISGVMIGVLFNFKNVLRAFALGRKTKNLYHDLISDEKALDTPLPELRNLIGIDTVSENFKISFSDVFLFLLFLIFGTIYSIVLLVFLPFLVIYTLIQYAKAVNKKQ